MRRVRPSTFHRRPTLAFRVHEDAYEAIRTGAEIRRLTMSQEAARLIDAGLRGSSGSGFSEDFLNLILGRRA